MNRTNLGIVLRWLASVAASKIRNGELPKASAPSRNGGVRSGAAALKRAAVKRNNKRKHPKC